MKRFGGDPIHDESFPLACKLNTEYHTKDGLPENTIWLYTKVSEKISHEISGIIVYFITLEILVYR